MTTEELVIRIEELRLSIPLSVNELCRELNIVFTTWARIKKDGHASTRVVRSMKEFIAKYEDKQ